MANIGVSQENCKQVAHKLNIMLSDEYLLFTKLFKYHWNVTGMAFGSLHEMFEKQYVSAFKKIDKIAERIRALEQWPSGTLSEFKEHSNIQEDPARNPDAQTMVSDLVQDHETIIRNMREEAAAIEKTGDMVTANFVEEMIEKHEKAAWMLRAHLV